QRLQEQERDLLRAEQLAAVGQLAAGVAHEIRNPLTGIKFLVEGALRPAAPTPLSDEDLRLIRQEVVRMERTVQGLLDFARTPPGGRRLLHTHPADRVTGRRFPGRARLLPSQVKLGSAGASPSGNRSETPTSSCEHFRLRVLGSPDREQQVPRLLDDSAPPC